MQDALRSTLEASIIPAFEMSCKVMFDQVDATFQKELSKHINDTQQQFNSMHSPLAITLRVCVRLIFIVVILDIHVPSSLFNIIIPLSFYWGGLDLIKYASYLSYFFFN